MLLNLLALSMALRDFNNHTLPTATLALLLKPCFPVIFVHNIHYPTHHPIPWQHTGKTPQFSRWSQNSKSDQVILPIIMAEGGYGGYDYEFVNELESKYNCLVCQNVLRDPMLTDCCGQHYCKSCLQQCTRSHIRECPHCRKRNYHTMLDKQLQREINELRIYCVNRSRKKCLWEDEISKLQCHLSSACPQREKQCKRCGKKYTRSKEAHLSECLLEYATRCPNGCGKQIGENEIETHRKTCLQEEVMCMLQGPNEKNEVATCGQRMPRSKLPSHEKICQFRTFECKFCKKASTYAAITGEIHTDIKQPKKPPEKGHYAECPDYPLYCRNKCCNKEIRRADMEQHLQECPLEPIQCERWEEGCREIVRRKDMSSHMKAYKKQHREYVWCAYVQKKEEVEQLKAELNATKDELAATKHVMSAKEAEFKTTMERLRAAEGPQKTQESNCVIS